jgi:hypothetical protein
MNIMPSPSNIGSMKTNPYRKCNKLDGLQVEPSSFNSFQAISVIGDARIYFSLAKQRVNFLQKHYQEEISVPTSEKERETFNGSK